jgi:hypothetical protein
LASVYHWPPSEILALGHRLRRRYLAQIEADEDAALLAGLIE